jgi:16S rRNA processing protein RimM
LAAKPRRAAQAAHAGDVSGTPIQMVVMARIAAPFGIKGWLKLQTFTEYSDSLDAFDTWFLAKGVGGNDWEEVLVEDFAVNAKAVVVKLKGCDDRNAAELMRKRDVAVPRDWLDETGSGEYYWIDLIGAEVVNEAGDRLGRVASLMETGANDVLVVQSGTSETLIPFVSDYVVNVDREKKLVTVHWQKEWQHAE